MERKRVMIFSVILIVVATVLACDTGTFTAFLDAGTATPTRTPRPTFTPRATATPEDTPTPEASPTSAASPTPTQRIVSTARPATKAPVVPTAVPKPVYAWHQRADQSLQGRCDAGPGAWEIKGRIHDGSDYAGGIHIVALDKNGQVVAQMDSLFREQMNLEWGVNCREEKNLFNYQLDVSAGRMNGPLILRLTKSAGDLTPISTDIRVDIDPNSGGRWYYDWTK